jgi:hypothetical protein
MNSRFTDAADGTEEHLPENYGFDPLKLDKEGQQRMQLAEIKHGRFSMISVTGFGTKLSMCNS